MLYFVFLDQKKTYLAQLQPVEVLLCGLVERCLSVHPFVHMEVNICMFVTRWQNEIQICLYEQITSPVNKICAFVVR